MTLNPKDDIIARFKRSNQGYLDNLNPEARQALEELIDLCYPYLPSIMAKSEPFEDEPMELTMMLVQQLVIKALKEEDSNAEILKQALHQVVNRIDNIDTELQAIRNIVNEALSKKRVVDYKPDFQFKLEVR